MMEHKERLMIVIETRFDTEIIISSLTSSGHYIGRIRLIPILVSYMEFEVYFVVCEKKHVLL